MELESVTSTFVRVLQLGFTENLGVLHIIHTIACCPLHVGV